jgi:dolichol-phosphate mannosyltransferase
VKTIVMIPTYNERENVREMIAALFALEVSGLEVLVVDDESPDGTAELAAELARTDSRVHVMVRKEERGRGRAGRDGFLEALRLGAERVVEMDADFSHDPRFIPDLLAALASADMAVGSRFVGGGSDLDRPWTRRLLTVAANGYAKTLLRLPVRDTNSGFRAFTRKALDVIEPSSLRSRGPSILHEVLFRAARRGLSVVEVPIEFVDRKKGHSKLNLRRLAAGYFWILRLWLGMV